MANQSAVDVVPTMTVNMLDKIIKGDDRDKQLIVFVRHKDGTTEYTDVTAVEPNEDNVVLVIPEK